MLTLLAILHVVIGVALVLFVLLQDPKGGAMGVFSGGSSANSFFGSSGASNFLTKATTWLAVMFAASCLTLTYITARHGGGVMENYAAPPTTPAAQTTPAPTSGAPGATAPSQSQPPQQQPPASDTK